MTNEARANQRDRDMIRDRTSWPGDYLCLKKYAQDGRDYEAFGVIASDREPVTIALRNWTPGLDLSERVEYPTFEEMFEDRWVVD